jgi:hypothetical protein
MNPTHERQQGAKERVRMSRSAEAEAHRRPHRPGSVRAHVIVGSVAGLLLLATAAIAGPGPNSTTIPSTGQDLSIALTSPPDGSTVEIPPGTTNVSGSVAIDAVAGDPICLVYIVDVSGSTDGNQGIDANGDGLVNSSDNFNGPSGDTEFGEILDGEIAGVLALHASIGNPANVYVGLVAFASNAANVDVGSQGGFQYFVTPPQLDSNSANGVDIGEALRTFRSGEGGGGSVGQFSVITSGTLGNGTDFDDPLEEMNQAFDNCPEDGTNIAFFISDGESNDSRCVDLECVPELTAAINAGTIVHTIGVGAGADGEDLGYIAAQTGGTYTQVTDPSDLVAELPGLDPAGIDHCEVDGVDVPLDALGNFTATATCQGPGPLVVTATCFANDVDMTQISADLTLSCEAVCPTNQGQPDCSEAACDGLPCDDGNACTQTDTCTGGVCAGSNPVVCSDPGECLGAACDPGTGDCLPVNDPNGTDCNDGDVCTEGEECTNGVCGGGGPAPNDTPCNADGDACTVGDICEAGICTPGPEVQCADDSCLACDPNTGICEVPVADGEECDIGGDQCKVDQCVAGVCTETGITLPPEECDEGVKIFGCRLIDGVKYIRPLLAKRTQFTTRVPGRAFIKWNILGELVIPGGLPDVTFDPDSQVSKLILSQDAIIYPPGNPDDPIPVAPTLQPNLSNPCSKKLGFCQSGSSRQPRFKFRLSPRDADLATAVGLRFAKIASAPPGSGIRNNRVKFRAKGRGGPAGISVDPGFLPDVDGLPRVRQTIRIDNVCFTAVLSCLNPPDEVTMKCLSRQAGEIDPEP